jgi:hypothetical protein
LVLSSCIITLLWALHFTWWLFVLLLLGFLLCFLLLAGLLYFLGAAATVVADLGLLGSLFWNGIHFNLCLFHVVFLVDGLLGIFGLLNLPNWFIFYFYLDKYMKVKWSEYLILRVR